MHLYPQRPEPIYWDMINNAASHKNINDQKVTAFHRALSMNPQTLNPYLWITTSLENALPLFPRQSPEDVSARLYLIARTAGLYTKNNPVNNANPEELITRYFGLPSELSVPDCVLDVCYGHYYRKEHRYPRSNPLHPTAYADALRVFTSELIGTSTLSECDNSYNNFHARLIEIQMARQPNNIKYLFYSLLHWILPRNNYEPRDLGKLYDLQTELEPHLIELAKTMTKERKATIGNRGNNQNVSLPPPTKRTTKEKNK